MLTIDAESRPRLADRLGEVLAQAVGAERVRPDAHFFDDLGADSMTMARFCARVRKHPDLPSISMREVYRNPTLVGLAAALSAASAAGADALEPAEVSGSAPARTSTAAYWICGLVQVTLTVAYIWAVAGYATAAGRWVLSADGAGATSLRTVAAGTLAAGVACGIPILAKWALVGSWRVTEIQVWSPAYLRLWTVKTLLRSSPIPLTAGTPLYNVFLRALGADIGRGALILSRRVPLVTDLITVGPGAVVRKDVFFNGYHAEAGRIRTGPVTIGARAHVGEGSVLGLDTTVGDDARLGHASSLQDGEQVPAGERRDGFAAQETAADDGSTIGGVRIGPRPVLYTLAQLTTALLLVFPLSIAGVAGLVAVVEARTGLFTGSVTSWEPYAHALWVAAAGLLGFLVVAFAVVVTVPRLLHLLLRPGRTYPLHGVHYWAQRSVERLSNLTFFPRLLGDSSYVVPYLRAVGYRMPDLVQTGSNFGLEVKHDNPFLTTIGSGTMVADGLSVINVDYSGSSFRLADTAIGAGSFLGNYVVYPPQASVGDDCLLATKVMVPTTGPSWSGTGLLGAPAFEIPRTVRRDARFEHLGRGDDLRAGLAAKNRHNLVTIALYLATQWLLVVALLILANVAVASAQTLGAFAFALAGVVGIAVRVGLFVVAERASTGFRHLQPRYCSIYDRQFWAHERYWKLAQQPLLLDGTPFKSLTWRLMGVRIGRRVFDDGCAIVEKTLTTIGDDCTLNVRSIVQAHSQEDGSFKSDHIVIGAGCTLGTASLVHYGTTMGDGSVLAPDSFLMKGQEVPAHTRWAGNPAQELT